jgi:hypothetical protein
MASGDGADAAEALIAHLAEHDPERLAELFTRWINSDRHPNESRRHPSPPSR